MNNWPNYLINSVDKNQIFALLLLMRHASWSMALQGRKENLNYNKTRQINTKEKK